METCRVLRDGATDRPIGLTGSSEEGTLSFGHNPQRDLFRLMAQLDPGARPETLGTQDFLRLLGGLIDAGWTPG